jgi:photosystem II stability/assembly factor-like uncharacterized protein
MYASSDEGRTWHGGPVEGFSDFVAVDSSAQVVVGIARKGVVVSEDRGNTWFRAQLPKEISGVADVAITNDSKIFIAAREGAYRSEDGGRSWHYLRRLPVNQLTSIFFDEEGKRLLTTSITTTHLFQSTDDGATWKRAETGWIVRGVRSSRGRVIATTAFDGIVAQPDSGTAQQRASRSTESAGGSQD